MRQCLATGLLCLTLTLTLTLGAEAQEPTADTISHEALIERLGHPLYAERRDARRRLLTEGLLAFDALRAGRDDPDPEVASASESLLNELTLDWAWLGDPTAVRRLLSDYDQLFLDARQEVIAALAALPNQQGVAALARLARFEPSDRLAGQAAATLLASKRYTLNPQRERAIEQACVDLENEFGTPERFPALWLRLATAEQDQESSVVNHGVWRGYATQQTQRLRGGRDETSLAVVATLDWRWLRSALRAGEADSALAAVEALGAIEPDERSVRLRRAIRWAIDAERPEIAAGLIDTHSEDLQNKRGLYTQAEVAAVRGDTESSAALAAQAIDAAVTEQLGTLDSTLKGPRVLVAEWLRERGLEPWAEAEYLAASEPLEPLDNAALYARWKLANHLFDGERYGEISAVLRPWITLLDESKPLREEYAQLQLVKRGFLPRHHPIKSRPTSALAARERLAAAFAAKAIDDREAELGALREAIAEDMSDADVVIAMYRVDDAPEDFAREARGHAARLRRDYERLVWENADEPNPAEASEPFNHWAWLVGNTEGDFDKAVRYSQRSLEILPETGGFLDTLGRCLFSAGQIEEAIETQRRAIELEPGMKVMRRQLAEFERAFAEQGSAAEDAVENPVEITQ